MSRRGTEGISSVVQRRRWKESEGQLVVTAWKQSGKPMTVFAREHGLVVQRLSRWVARLGRSSNGRVRFHRVQLVGGLRGTSAAIEVALVDGRRVVVPEGFAAEELERVLGVLEGRG